MEVTFFILGMLAIGAVVFATATVVGLFKIFKLTKQINDLNLKLDREAESIYREMQHEHQSTWQQFESVGRDVTMVERTVMNQIDNTQQELTRAVGQLQSDCLEGKRYTDSRIDKLIDHFEMNKADEKKQIIKG